MPKRQTCTDMQMVTAELRYDCIRRSFLINEGQIPEFSSGYIVNFVKHIRSSSLDMMLVNKELSFVNPTPLAHAYNQRDVQPRGNISAVAHHASHHTACTVLSENHLHLFHFQRSFESGRLSPRTVSGWYSNVRRG
ncbi:hypothetical protein TNCV_4785801 [Trichonephila clavipes]|nr:hypothetical protein TNCV_4785801 [Trichonephila clavipes]